MTQGQKFAVEQLQEVAAASDGLLEVISVAERSGSIAAELSIYCGNMDRESDGLPLRERERFFVFILSDFPFDTPTVCTRHTRFAGFPHVQWKRWLCLYLSPATEWNPERRHVWLHRPT